MGSSDSEGSISSSLPVPKLIKRIKHSFLERDYVAVRTILMDRKRGMKTEIESLSRERDSAREEVSLLEGKVALRELERLKVEHKLVQIEKKCRDLENTVSGLREEQQLIVDKVDVLTKEKLENERLARAYRDKCDCLETKAVETKQVMDDLTKEKLENERLARVYRDKCDCLETKAVETKQVVDDLTKEKLENERLARVYRDKCDCLETKAVETKQVVDDLTKEKLENERLARVYRDKCDCLETKAVETKQVMDDLKHERLGAIGTIEDLRRKLSEAEKVVDELKRTTFEANRTVEETMLKKLESKKEAEFHRRRLDSLVPRITKIEEYLAGMLNVNVEDLAEIAGNGNLSQFFTREDFDHTVETCNEREPPPGSGEGHSRKFASSPSAVGDKLTITGISNSSKPSLEAPVLSGGIREDLSENEMNCEEKFGQSPCSRDVVLEKSNKRARSARMGHKKSNEPVDTQFSLWIFNGSSSDEDSTGSDDSCSDSRIDELVASLRHANSTEN